LASKGKEKRNIKIERDFNEILIRAGPAQESMVCGQTVGLTAELPFQGPSLFA